MYQLKSVTLVQRAYRSEYKNKKCPTKATILNLSRKFDRTGSLLDLPPKPKNERETRIEARIRASVRYQLMSVFRILFAVIYFLKTYASSVFSPGEPLNDASSQVPSHFPQSTVTPFPQVAARPLFSLSGAIRQSSGYPIKRAISR